MATTYYLMDTSFLNLFLPHFPTRRSSADEFKHCIALTNHFHYHDEPLTNFTPSVLNTFLGLAKIEKLVSPLVTTIVKFHVKIPFIYMQLQTRFVCCQWFSLVEKSCSSCSWQPEHGWSSNDKPLTNVWSHLIVTGLKDVYWRGMSLGWASE